MSVTDETTQTTAPATPELTHAEIVEQIRHQHRPDAAVGDALVASLDQTAQRAANVDALAAGVRGETVTPAGLSSGELLELLADQPAPGTARAKLAAARRSGGSPQVPLLEWLADQPQPEPPVTPEPYANPMLATTREAPRPLTAEELAYLDRFRGVAPSQVSIEDASELARLELLAESGAGQRLVADVVAPLRRHHDRLAEEAELRAELARLRPSPWRQRQENLEALATWLAETLANEAEADLRRHLTDDTPSDLTEQLVAVARAGATPAAQKLLRDRWDREEGELSHRRAEVEQQLLHLAWGGDPKSSRARQQANARKSRQRQRTPKQEDLRAALYEQFGVTGR